MITAILIIVLILLLAIIAAGYFLITRRTTFQSEELRGVIEQVNNAHERMYTFDKTLENNLRKMEANLKTINATTTQAVQEVQEVKQATEQKQAAPAFNPQELTIADRYTFRHNGDALHLTHEIKNTPATLRTQKLQIDDVAAFKGPATFAKPLSTTDDVRVGRDLILEGDNRWILATPETGKDTTSLALAPFSRGAWDWANQFTFTNQGALHVPGGFTVKGGKSVHNPRSEPSVFAAPQDGRNYLRGDTTLQGNAALEGALHFNKDLPGAMVEKRFGKDDADRFGMGMTEPGQFRLYASSANKDAALHLSLAKSANAFDDLATLSAKRTLDIKAPTTHASSLTATQGVLLSTQSLPNQATRLTMGKDRNTPLEIWTATPSGEKKMANLTADGSFCFSSVCLKDNKGTLQLCNGAGANCKDFKLS